MATAQGTDALASPQVAPFNPTRYLDEVTAENVVARCVHLGEPIAKLSPRRARSGARAGGKCAPGATKQHRQALAALVAPAIQGTPDGEWAFGVRAVFYVQTHHRKDVDNMLKVVVDAMKRLVFDDDCQVKEMMAWSILDCERPRTEFVVYRIHKIEREKGVCVRCGAAFRRYRSWKARLYCSRRCNTIALTSSVEVPCAHCGKTLLREPAEVAKNKGGEFFCSGACIGLRKRRAANCATCGALISRPLSFAKPGQATFYCSVACRSVKQVGRKLPLSPEALSDRVRRAWETRRAKRGR
jgi:Holliday junction resolvase RusA-like endonuclease